MSVNFDDILAAATFGSSIDFSSFDLDTTAIPGLGDHHHLGSFISNMSKSHDNLHHRLASFDSTVMAPPPSSAPSASGCTRQGIIEKPSPAYIASMGLGSSMAWFADSAEFLGVIGNAVGSSFSKQIQSEGSLTKPVEWDRCEQQ